MADHPGQRPPAACDSSGRNRTNRVLVHGQALPRGDPRPRDVGRAPVSARLHVDEERAAAAWPDHEGAEALGTPQEAGAPAAARDAGVPGWVETCLAAAGAGA